MRSKIRGPIEYRTDAPTSCIDMAKRRTQPLIDFYGNHIRSINIETLVASAYLQGVEDMDSLHQSALASEAGLLGLPGVSSGL